MSTITRTYFEHSKNNFLQTGECSDLTKKIFDFLSPPERYLPFLNEQGLSTNHMLVSRLFYNILNKSSPKDLIEIRNAQRKINRIQLDLKKENLYLKKVRLSILKNTDFSQDLLKRIDTILNTHSRSLLKNLFNYFNSELETSQKECLSESQLRNALASFTEDISILKIYKRISLKKITCLSKKLSEIQKIAYGLININCNPVMRLFGGRHYFKKLPILELRREYYDQMGYLSKIPLQAITAPILRGFDHYLREFFVIKGAHRFDMEFKLFISLQDLDCYLIFFQPESKNYSLWSDAQCSKSSVQILSKYFCNKNKVSDFKKPIYLQLQKLIRENKIVYKYTP